MGNTPEGRVVGKVSVKVIPDVSKFREELREELRKGGDDEEVDLNVDGKVDADKLARKTRAAAKQATEAASREKVKIGSEVAADEMAKAAREAAKQATESASKQKWKVDPPDTEDAEQKLDRFQRRYLRKMETLLGNIDIAASLTPTGEVNRKIFDELAKDFRTRVTSLDLSKDSPDVVASLRFAIDKLYRDIELNAKRVDLIPKNKLSDAKREIERFTAANQAKATFAAEMVDFDKAVEDAKAASERSWAELDARLNIVVNEDQITQLRTKLSDRVVVPVNIKPQFDKGGITRSLATAVAGVKEFTSVAASPFKLLAAAPGIAMKAFARLGPEVVALTALIAALLPPVLALGAGFITLAPAALAALVPMGVITLGLDGIKKAAEAAKPAFEELKKGISSVFTDGLPGQQSMTAGFKALADNVIPNVKDSMQNVAQSLTNQFNAVVGVLSSPKGLDNLNNIFNNVAAGLDNAKGGLKGFTDGILELVSAISNKFPSLGQWFTDLGGKFSGWVDKFTSVEDSNGLTGLERTIQNVRTGIEGLTGVFQSFFGQGLKDIQDADFGAGMKKFFDTVKSFVDNTLPSLTEGFKQVADLLKQLEPMFDLIGGATNLAGLFVNPGKTISEAVERFKKTGSLKEAFTGVGKAAEEGGQEAAAGLNKGLESGLEQTKKTIEDSMKPQPGVVKGEFGGGIDDDGIGPAITGKVNTAISAAKSTLLAFQGEFAGMIATAIEPINQIPEKLYPAFANMGAAFMGAFVAIKEIVNTEVTSIADTIAVGFYAIPAKLLPVWAAFGTSVGSAIGGIKGFIANAGFADAFGQAFSGVAGRVASALTAVPATVGAAITPTIGIVQTLVLQLIGQVNQAGAQVAAVAGASFGQFPPAVQGAMAPAIASVGTIGQQMVSAALSFGGAMESAGRSIGASFAAGIASSSNLVSAAASGLMAAARAFFPNSPAKEGPFSGSGWVDNSGIAIGQAFAGGIASQQATVVDSASTMMQEVQKTLDEGLAIKFQQDELDIKRKMLQLSRTGDKRQEAELQRQTEYLSLQKDRLAMQGKEAQYWDKYRASGVSLADEAQSFLSAIQGSADALSSVTLPTVAGPGKSTIYQAGKLDEQTKSELDALKYQQEYIDLQRQSLQLQTNGASQAQQDELKRQMEMLSIQKERIGMQAKELEYWSKYQDTSRDLNDVWTESQTKAESALKEFGKAAGKQAMNDLGISGEGAVTGGLEAGVNYVFQVLDVASGLAAQQTVQNKKSLQYR